MSIREDILRAKSQEETFKKQLQQAELEIRDHKNKMEMAQEDLQKEKVSLFFLDCLWHVITSSKFKTRD